MFSPNSLWFPSVKHARNSDRGEQIRRFSSSNLLVESFEFLIISKWAFGLLNFGWFCFGWNSFTKPGSDSPKNYVFDLFGHDPGDIKINCFSNVI